MCLLSNSTFAEDLILSVCKECKDDIDFAQRIQKKIKGAIRGITKLKIGTKTSPCTPNCSYVDALDSADLRNLTAAYRNSQGVMHSAFNEIQKRDRARYLKSCTEDKCPSQNSTKSVILPTVQKVDHSP